MARRVGAAAAVVLAILMFVALVNLFAPVAWPPAGVALVSYSDFVAQVKRDTIESAEMRGDMVVATTDAGQRFATRVPWHRELADRLAAAGTRVLARPAEADVNPVVGYVLSWTPFLAVCAAFWWRIGWVGRRTRESARSS